MKKLLCVLLTFVLFLGALPVSLAGAQGKPLKLLVTSDTHWRDVGEVQPDGFFRPRDSLGQMTSLTPLLVERFLKDAAESDAEAVLITGDLTDWSADEHAQAFADILGRFEDETGKAVYVVPGNHDLRMGDDPDDHRRFRGVYARFGYDEALSVEETTSSYAVDLGEGYRLLGVNSNKAGGAGHLSDELLAWIKNQSIDAKRSGKKVIAMMHQQLLEHYTLEQKIDDFYLVDNFRDARKLFAEWDICVTFTGHLHMGDVAKYRGKSTIYDITNPSLSTWPLVYREVTLEGENVRLESKTIDSLDLTHIVPGYSDEQKEMIASDPVRYAYGCQQDSFVTEYLMEFLPADFFVPLYGEGDTVEAKAKALGYKLPESDYETTDDVFTAFWAGLIGGDEHIGGNSVEVRLTLDAAYALGTDYLKKNVPVLEKLLRFKPLAFLGHKLLNNFLLRALLSVVLRGFTIDRGPADNNVTLKAYQ